MIGKWKPSKEHPMTIAELVDDIIYKVKTHCEGRYVSVSYTHLVYSSVYGWAIDQAAEAAQLAQEIQSGTQTTREPIYEQTANSHGLNDLGNTYIEVDLSNQHMYYYQSGSLIFDSEFVSGNMSYSDRQTHACLLYTSRCV